MTVFLSKRREYRAVGLLVGLSLMITTFDIQAQSLNLKKLLMPGELGNSHAGLEADCQNCHSNFNKSAQSQLCLNCHEEVQSDLQLNRGFHAQLSKNLTSSLNCMQCHTDHKGQSHSLTLSAQEQFNHALTEFNLEGAHLKVNCNQCHETGKLKRDADKSCSSCHQNDDTHRGELGENCSDCHNPKAWQEHSFDHDTTDFTLRGEHQQSNCTSCHVNQQYEGTADQCFQCHAVSDVHRGNRGEDCRLCHTPISWQETEFDHNRATDFKLHGAHKTLSCGNCHRETALEIIAGSACIDCHRSDDLHLEQRGDQCGACHSESKWSDIKFSHSEHTDFPLRGAHRQQACETCHTETTSDNSLGKSCIDCHKHQDIHEGAMGDECVRCHNEEGWAEKVIFDHDLTYFPLTGLHAITTCEQCHVERPFNKVKGECINCHKADDVHEESLGSSCESCHTPNDWATWIFDHNSQTQFELTGSHEELACEACHIKPVRKKASASKICGHCHDNDDIHSGNFGLYCDRCHSTINFGGFN